MLNFQGPEVGSNEFRFYFHFPVYSDLTEIKIFTSITIACVQTLVQTCACDIHWLAFMV